jgi:hypothetical protein
MPRPLAGVVLVEELDEPVDIVRLERGTHLFDKQGNDSHRSVSLPKRV